MKPTRAALILLAVQLALVLSIAGKFLYERKVCPRIWVRTAQVDPDLPLRGRYLALQLDVDSCPLPHDKQHYTPDYAHPVQFNGTAPTSGYWNWSVTLTTENGHLIPHLLDPSITNRPRSSQGQQTINVPVTMPCGLVPLSAPVEYFVPENAKIPRLSESADSLWVEVTMPPAGPPRPTQLAMSTKAGFKPLRFE